jgi:hypothetical protein
MHGERIAERLSQERSESSPRLEVHGATAVNADNAVILPETAAPQAATRVDVADPEAEARAHVSGSNADVRIPFERAEIYGPKKEQRDAGDHRGGGRRGVTGERSECSLRKMRR